MRCTKFLIIYSIVIPVLSWAPTELQLMQLVISLYGMYRKNIVPLLISKQNDLYSAQCCITYIATFAFTTFPLDATSQLITVFVV